MAGVRALIIVALGAGLAPATMACAADQSLSDVLFARAAPGAVSLSAATTAPFDPSVYASSPATPGMIETWRTSVASRPVGGGVESVSVSTGRAAYPGLNPAAAGGAQDVDIHYSRDWPGALKVRAGRLNLDVTPQAGLGVGAAGSRAEAGAVVRMADPHGAAVARTDGRGRWYVFAAVGGRTVGLNMGSDPAARRGGWYAEGAQSQVDDGRIGVGWSQGPMEAAAGYVHRDIKFQTGPFATQGWSDSEAAVSLTFHPR